MGVGLGLTLALILTLTPAFGVSALIALGSNPHDILLTFVGTCALMFGVGAALTGLVFKLTEACLGSGGYFGSNSSFNPNAPAFAGLLTP